MVSHSSSEQFLIACAEGSRGTLSTANGIQEPCNSVANAIAGGIVTYDAYLGTTVTRVDAQPTQRYSNLSFGTAYRADGLPVYLFGSLLGTSSDTITAGTTVSSIAITAAGTGGSAGTYALVFSGGSPITPATGTFTVSAGGINAITITSGGTGYSSAPTVDTSAAPGLSGATLTASLAGAKTHTMQPSTTTTAGKTYTIYKGSGDNSNVEQIVFGQVGSIHLAAGIGTFLACDVTMMGEKSNLVAKPTPTIFPSTDMTMTMNGTITLTNAAGGTYSAIITSTDLTLARNINVVNDVQHGTPQDFVPGPLTLDGSVNFEYEGSGTNSFYQDFLAQGKQAPTAGSKCTVKYTDAYGYSIAISWWPYRLADVTISENGDLMAGQASFSMYNNLPSVNAASPVVTSPQSVVIVSPITANLS